MFKVFAVIQIARMFKSVEPICVRMNDNDGVMEIDDIAVLEILNNPTRLKILSNLEEPSSVKSVAEAMEVPPTRLYYHVNLLEDAGLIKVVETRKVGAMIERRYQSVADTFRPGQGLFENNVDLERLAKVTSDIVLDGARLDAERGLLRHFEAMAEGKNRSELHPGTVSRSVRSMSPATAADFLRRLEELVAEWSNSDSDEDSANPCIGHRRRAVRPRELAEWGVGHAAVAPHLDAAGGPGHGRGPGPRCCWFLGRDQPLLRGGSRQDCLVPGHRSGCHQPDSRWADHHPSARGLRKGGGHLRFHVVVAGATFCQRRGVGDPQCNRERSRFARGPGGGGTGSNWACRFLSLSFQPWSWWWCARR